MACAINRVRERSCLAAPVKAGLEAASERLVQQGCVMLRAGGVAACHDDVSFPIQNAESPVFRLDSVRFDLIRINHGSKRAGNPAEGQKRFLMRGGLGRGMACEIR